MAELTEGKIRERFLRHVEGCIRSWLNETRTPDVEGKMRGLAFSILVAIDGESALPAFKLIADPHPEDKEFRKSKGEDWYPENINIAGCLHNELSCYRPKKTEIGKTA